MRVGKPSVGLRTASRADLNAILEIERASFPDPPWSRQSFAVLIDNPRVSFLVAAISSDPSAATAATGARVDGPASEVLGYVVTWIAADEAEIANLAVRSDRRRAGIGRLLVDSAVAAAVSGGARSLYLDVRQSNRSARALYEARGFVMVGRRAKYYRNPTEDALVLRLVAGGGQG